MFVSGDVRIPHFRHGKGQSCLRDPNILNDVQDECSIRNQNACAVEEHTMHSKWQHLFHPEYREKIVRHNGRFCIADVFIPLASRPFFGQETLLIHQTESNDRQHTQEQHNIRVPDWIPPNTQELVVEIQHSPLSIDQIVRRCRHYGLRAFCHIIWIVDVSHIEHVLEHTLHLFIETHRYVFRGKQHSALVNLLQAYFDGSISEKPCIFLDRGREDENIYFLRDMPPRLNESFITTEPVSKDIFLSTIENLCRRTEGQPGCLAENHSSRGTMPPSVTDIKQEKEAAMYRNCLYENDYRSTLLSVAPVLRGVSSETVGNEGDILCDRIVALDRFFLMIEKSTVYEMTKFVGAINASLQALPFVSINLDHKTDKALLPFLYSLLIHIIPEGVSIEFKRQILSHFRKWVQKLYSTNRGHASSLHPEAELLFTVNAGDGVNKNSQYVELVDQYLSLPEKALNVLFALMTKTFHQNRRACVGESHIIKGITVFDQFVIRRHLWMADKILDHDKETVKTKELQLPLIMPDKVIHASFEGGWDTMCETVQETERRLQEKEEMQRIKYDKRVELIRQKEERERRIFDEQDRRIRQTESKQHEELLQRRKVKKQKEIDSREDFIRYKEENKEQLKKERDVYEEKFRDLMRREKEKKDRKDAIIRKRIRQNIDFEVVVPFHKN